MADEVAPLTTTESRVTMRHRAACTCKWHGEWHDHLGLAKNDRDQHIQTTHN